MECSFCHKVFHKGEHLRVSRSLLSQAKTDHAPQRHERSRKAQDHTRPLIRLIDLIGIAQTLVPVRLFANSATGPSVVKTRCCVMNDSTHGSTTMPNVRHRSRMAHLLLAQSLQKASVPPRLVLKAVLHPT
jgi:hypothetical protein